MKDADVQALDEQQEVGSGEGSADPDVVQAAVAAQGDAVRLVTAANQEVSSRALRTPTDALAARTRARHLADTAWRAPQIRPAGTPTARPSGRGAPPPPARSPAIPSSDRPFTSAM
jgi:hypothetical protein